MPSALDPSTFTEEEQRQFDAALSGEAPVSRALTGATKESKFPSALDPSTFNKEETRSFRQELKRLKSKPQPLIPKPVEFLAKHFLQEPAQEIGATASRVYEGLGIPEAQQLIHEHITQPFLTPVANIIRQASDITADELKDITDKIEAKVPATVPAFTHPPDLTQMGARGMFEQPEEQEPKTASGAITKALHIGLRSPEFLTRVGGELAGLTIESAPTFAALGVAGSIGKGLGIIPKMAHFMEHTNLPVLRTILPPLVFRAKFHQKSKAAFEKFDIEKIKGKIEARELGRKIAIAAEKEELPGAVRPHEHQEVMRFLMEQPEVRDVVTRINAADVEINQAKHLRTIFPMGQRRAGVTGPTFAQRAGLAPEPFQVRPSFVLRRTPGKERAGFPEAFDEVPIKDFGAIAEEAAQEFGKTRKQMIRMGIKDPDFFIRFNEGNYAPIVYANRRIAVMPGQNNLKAYGIRERTGFLKMRGEMTAEERLALGEVELGPSVAYRLSQEKTLIATRQLFSDLARNPAVVQPGKGLEAGAIETIGGKRFVQMGSDKSLGPLAGKLMKAEEAAEVNAVNRIYNNPNMPDKLRILWAAWKFGKTILNPKTQIANFASNSMLAHANGLSPYRMDIYRTAYRGAKTGKGIWEEEMRRFNAPWIVKGGLQTAEINDATMINPFKGESIYESVLLGLPRFMMSNPVSRELANIYQANEAFFKSALYISARQRGLRPTAAIKMADEGIINYDHAPHLVKQLRSLPGGLPFITFTYGATKVAAKTAAENPGFYLHYALAAQAFNEVQKQIHSVSDEQMDQIYAMFPGTIPLISGRDARGGLMVHDVARFTFMGDLLPGRIQTEVVPGEAAGVIGDLAESILLKSPIVQEIAAQLTGVDPFFKSQFAEPGIVGRANLRRIAGGLGLGPKVEEQIIGATQTARDVQAEARLRHFARTILPELTGGGATQDIIAAIQGKESFLGVPQTPEQAVAASLLGKERSVTEEKLRMAGELERAMQLEQKALIKRAREKAKRRK